jgi:ABC-2 type transport system permease protein
MKYRNIKNILFKEWQLIFTDVNSALLIIFVPLLIVGQGILYVWLAVNFGGQSAVANTFFSKSLDSLIASYPSIAQLGAIDQFKVLLLNQFNFYLLLIPTVIAATIATFSLVDEKLSGSLEAVLATPVKTIELLFAKALAGAIPALLMTWISGAIFLILVYAIGWGSLIPLLITPNWFLSLFLLTTAVALLSFILGVIGSARAKDAKNAQNYIVIVVLPVLILIVVQLTGIIWLTSLLTLLVAIALFIIDFFMLRLAVRLFKRESIALEWK